MIVDGPSPFILFRDPPGQQQDRPEPASPEYLDAREAAERAAAKLAASPEAGRRHRELAQAYARLARESKLARKP